MVTQTAPLTIQQYVVLPKPVSKIVGRTITTRIVGVSFGNRQESIAKVKTNDLVWLEMDIDNPFDKNAILVTRGNGEELGFLNRFLAANLIPYFVSYKKPIKGYAKLLIGGSWDDFSLGLIITFKVPKITETHRKHQKRQFIDWED